ncbi:MAG: YbaK/EbsC family protein [Chloroflexi bacterium]|nr:YbaK/EbsC family protein [Chloroflexota bacterium]
MVEMSVLGPADVRRALAAADCADIEIRFFAESTATAPQAAAAIGCELGQIIKSLAFLIAGEPCLVLMGGDGRVEERALAAQYGVGRKRVRAANAAQCVEIFGYAPGGVPPVGLRSEIPVWLDEGLRRYGVLYAAGGAPNAIFGISRARLERLCGEVGDAGQSRYLAMRRS